VRPIQYLHRVFRIHIFCFAQQLQDLARARCQSAVLRESLSFGCQRVELARFEVEGLELCEVIAQELEPSFTILRRCGRAIALLAQL